MHHIVSATALSTGEHLAMCGHVFPSYRAAVDAGHPVGNYMPTVRTLAEGHSRGVDCEACIVRMLPSGWDAVADTRDVRPEGPAFA